MRISLGYLFFKIIYYLVNSIKEEKINKFSKILGGIAYFLSSKYRKIVISNLETAFGKEWSKEKINKTARDVFQSQARNLIEFLRFEKLNEEKIKKIVEIEGRENLDNALSKGNGAILISAHLSNWELGAATISAYGYEIYEVVRELSDKMANDLVSNIKINKGINLIARDKSTIKNVIKLLRENKMIVLAVDQNAGLAGTFVDFFSKPTSTFAGPLIISRRTKSPIVPIFITRKENGFYKIFVEKEFKLEENENYSEFIFTNLQNLTKIIERYIKNYPEQWFWLHQRWKTQPEDKYK